MKYTQQSGGFHKKPSVYYQAVRVLSETARWKARPKIGPLSMPASFDLLILFSTANYCVVGAPSRWFLYIMARTPSVDETELEDIRTRCHTEWGYDMSKFRMVPQQWPEAPEAEM